MGMQYNGGFGLFECSWPTRWKFLLIMLTLASEAL